MEELVGGRVDDKPGVAVGGLDGHLVHFPFIVVWIGRVEDGLVVPAVAKKVDVQRCVCALD